MTIINQKSISGITSITFASAGDDLLTFHSNNGTERFRIDNSGNTKITAGIVTTLTVTGNSTVGGTLGVTGDVDVADKIVHTGDTNTAIRFPAADTITAETAGSERLRIDSSGRMGLGTASPDSYDGNSNNFVIANTSGNAGMSFVTSSTGDGTISWADGTSGNERYRGSIGYNHTNDKFTISTAASSAVTIDSSGRLLIGTSSARTNFFNSSDSAQLQIEGTDSNNSALSLTRNVNSAGYAPLHFAKSRGTSVGSNTIVQSGDYLGGVVFSGSDGSEFVNAAAIYSVVDGTPGANDMPGMLTFHTTADGASSPTERLRITSGGKIQVTGTRGGTLQPSDNDSLEIFTSATSGNADTGSGLTFYNNDGNGSEIGGTIQVAKENGNTNNTAGYMRFCTRPNASDVAERMRIQSGGNVLIGQTNGSYGTQGHIFGAGGQAFHINPSDTVLLLNRQNNDGEIVRLSQDGATEGTISVSGSTVSYNGGHLARWSQLPSGAARTEILRGSVLSNLDEMCEWGEEDNEQLNRMKISDVEGDRNVSGVFQDWDDDDDTYINDFYCAMTGDFVIRIAQGTTVARGDLLMSAGDGTAKPQDDDIVRSKTIAKVTSTTVSTTYSDGSYCVPCVLMAC